MSTVVFPGQGAQHKGMGAGLFSEFHELTAVADRILGYSIEHLCVNDEKGNLNSTEFTQPALYTVNAFLYFKYLKNNAKPDILAGHSLGEYNALLAAEVFDFETGLKLVQRRGQLMSRATNGGMLAIIRSNQSQVEEILIKHQLKSIDVANYNSPTQIVLSGEASDIATAKTVFDSEKVFCIPLKVSGAFHSRQMKTAAKEYNEFLTDFEFSDPQTPVIANITGLPYQIGQTKDLLSQQLCGSVQWTRTIRYLMAIKQTDFQEVGPGQVLTKLNNEIIETTAPLKLIQNPPQKNLAEPVAPKCVHSIELGSKHFLKHHQVKYPYVVGSMGQGISSEKLVIKMANSGFLAFLGSEGLDINEVETLITSCKAALQTEQSYGINFHYLPGHEKHQKQLIDLCIEHKVPCLEVSGLDHISLELIKYRAKGLKRSNDQILIQNKIFLKTSKPEIASMFMQSAPLHILDKLLSEKDITPDEHFMAQTVPVVDDICVTGAGAWKTDQANLLVKLPEIIRLRDQRRNSLSHPVRVGCGGGIGTPESVAAVFMLGADFILTGSINQCTVEANTSKHTKKILSELSSEDTCYVPDGDMLESSSAVQVVRKGLYFPARAQKLYDLYRLHNSLDEISLHDKKQVEKHFFNRSFESIFQELIDTENSQEIKKANENRKYKMAKIFKWYFKYTQKLSLDGKQQEQDNYQIYCGPALGAFNQWVSGSSLAHWQNRYVDEIAIKLLNAASDFINSHTSSIGHT